LLEQSVERRLESDVPLGILLSGGVDSSLISLLAVARAQPQVRTFTAAFKGTALDEAYYAAQVARHVRSEHTEINVAMPSLRDLLPRLVHVYGEPFGDDSAIPTLALLAGIKPYATVVLTGDGGDEVFAGYKDARLFWLRKVLAPFVGITSVLGTGLPEFVIRSSTRRVREMGYALIALQPDGARVFHSLLRGGWVDYWRKRFMRPEAQRAMKCDEVERESAARFHAAGRDDLERYLNLTLERLTQSFLVKTDRASMAYSMEVRSPLLDSDLFAWSSGLARSILLKNGEPKSILKDLVDAQMGERFSRRRKMGFTPPLGTWLRHPETWQWVHERLTDKRSLAYSLFTTDAVGELITLHRDGQDQTGRLWKLLFLNEWHAHSYDTPGRRETSE
jgi:asparagine synthase (glutamine-hydrolysing)